MIFIFCLVTPVMYMGTLSEVYYRETPMRKEARERAMLARLKEKYEP